MRGGDRRREAHLWHHQRWTARPGTTSVNSLGGGGLGEER